MNSPRLLISSQSQKYSDQPIRGAPRLSGDARATQAPVTTLGWRSSVSAIPKGSHSGGFLIKNPTELEAAANATRLKGFIFVGNETVELGTTKGRPGPSAVKNVKLIGTQRVCRNTIRGDR